MRNKENRLECDSQDLDAARPDTMEFAVRTGGGVGLSGRPHLEVDLLGLPGLLGWLVEGVGHHLLAGTPHVGLRGARGEVGVPASVLGRDRDQSRASAASDWSHDGTSGTLSSIRQIYVCRKKPIS